VGRGRDEIPARGREGEKDLLVRHPEQSRLSSMRALTATLLLATAVGCKSNAAAPSGAPDAGLADADSGAPADAAPPPLSYDFGALESAEFGGTWQTEGVVVLHRGALVYEKYAQGWTATMRHITYSVSKTIGGALVGIAIDKGLLAKADSVCKYVTPPVGADPKLCDTTIEHLLHMSSGLQWIEDESDPTTSNTLELLYGNEPDMGAYVAAQPRSGPAGATFSYSSGDADLLALALKGALKGQDMRAWAQDQLFTPAGITSAIFEADHSGTLVFSSSCFMTPRDMARFGALFLTDGMNGATRVLPAGWATYAATPAPSVATPTSRSSDAGTGYGGSYGAQVWLNAASPTATQDTWEYPDEPVDGFQAEGHWGQKIVVVPSRQLVVVRVGNDRSPSFDPTGTDQLIGAAVAAIDKATQGDL
jgi:CubicO group peptidase (beta-lactamase class C family)